jgi:hypothetical protein
MLIDTGTSLGRVLGSVTINSGNQSGSLSNSRLTSGTPFYFCVPNTTGGWTTNSTPVVSFSGTTMTWTQGKNFNGQTAEFGGTIHYGVF